MGGQNISFKANLLHKLHKLDMDKNVDSEDFTSSVKNVDSEDFTSYVDFNCFRNHSLWFSALNFCLHSPVL